MSYTHNYIPYNCDILLIHKVHALTYPFPHKSSHSLQTISMPKHMDVFGPIHINPGLFSTIPKQSSGLSVGSPLTKHRVHFVEPNSMAISGLLHTKTQFIAYIISQDAQTVRGLSKQAPKISTFWYQVLGPIKRSFKASNQLNHQ